ncbi:MAG: hypothetical protein RBS68_16355 [Anaerolineales bacterium]|jgi:hypothetical protein|nr:hypothetical protein [Anaerolineales bacterium]
MALFLSQIKFAMRTPFFQFNSKFCGIAIIGKFKAWVEGRSRKHETDIYEMMVFHYLGENEEKFFDEHYIDEQVRKLGTDVAELWQEIKDSAHKNAG